MNSIKYDIQDVNEIKIHSPRERKKTKTKQKQTVFVKKIAFRDFFNIKQHYSLYFRLLQVILKKKFSHFVCIK